MGRARRYDEAVADVVVDDIDRPVAWSFRRRGYWGGAVLGHWVEIPREWWLNDDDVEVEIEHWIVEARSAYGTGQVELARDMTSGEWRLVTILAESQLPLVPPEPPRTGSPRGMTSAYISSCRMDGAPHTL
jgi:hypothetical protein